MPKRKRTSSNADRASTKAKKPMSPSSPLLSLPEELRRMIWKAVVDTPILLHGSASSWGAPVQITAIRSLALDPQYVKYPCDKNHQATRSAKKRQGPGPLSWLRTNKQIHDEAQPVIYANMSLHVCQPMVLAAVLANTSNLQPRAVRSLSICLRIKIEHNLRDGFLFAHVPNHAGHRWARGRACLCPRCFATASLPQNGSLMDQVLPALNELRLRVYFTCRESQGNQRPVIGRLRDGRSKIGRLYRPKNPPPLTWVENEESVQGLVKELGEQEPLGMFCGGMAKSVVVQILTESIEHNDGNDCPNFHDRCWCRSRGLDDATTPKALITSLIRKQLSQA